VADPTLITSPLHDRHLALGATLGAFGGWSMPLSYPDGTVAEHGCVREAVGMFDVSHLGKLAITGPGAAAFVDRCLTADLGRITPGHAQYTLCCTDRGGIVDDLIVYLAGPDDVLAVPNAANAATVAEMLRAAAPAGVEVTDRHRELAVIAVQGPRSAEVVTAALGEVGALDYMAFTDAGDVRVCRTGYTGEHGYELLVPAERAGAVWDALMAEAGPLGGRACGLGARDTLRTEMGYPLHGQDLSTDITPVQAGSSWAVGWDKPQFWGRAALVAEKEAGPARRLRGLRATGRGVPRPGMAVLGADATPVGTTTSGTFSPTLRTGIALALIDTAAGVKLGDTVAVDVRGRVLECTVVRPPFVPSHVR
jgi:aminomethyltransferase